MTILVVSISLVTISVIVSLSFAIAVTAGNATLSSTIYFVFALLLPFVVILAVLLFLVFFSAFAAAAISPSDLKVAPQAEIPLAYRV